MNLRIRDLREDQDLKQKQIAEYLLCDQSLYSKYERGERELPLRLAVKLAEYYGVSMDYLLGLTDVRTPYPRKGKKR
ncbi:helix-turn-helix transcriptional regulator [Oscillibacter sp.]|uniref:helix-turn-helix domain-containing protein n=1 Tax=Oscillospiraceae TaxID=216572 RepID=UPI001FA22C32|nr:helix-turn-helix transcriptional regulator [Oscillibacter sp.]MBS6356095.1 helix-turn-helix transcriptional regulator [Oscillibacter sp.]HJB32725.1 helix-turn-helix domain-containing protein [Candidatus Oscillibacter excrementavium]HJB52501.1 helix-turn-helix domain-containing protein [Candidatus Oscillibacter pullicola]